MKTRNLVQLVRRSSTLIVTFAVVIAASFPAQAQGLEDYKPTAQSSGGAGLSTGLISLLPGQSVRVAAVNVGGKDIQLDCLFVFVTEQGKVAGLVICPGLIVSPGDAAFDTFKHPGGANRMLMYVQIRVRQNQNDIKELVPSVEIFDEQADRSIGLLHGGDFVSFRPIFNPPQPPPEN